jgi:SNF2 family DNA or RNA helicase
MKAEDWLDMPDRIDNMVEIKLTEDLRAKYKELQREFILEIQDQVIDAVTAAALMGKLQQFNQGAIYTESGWTKVHDLKLEALDELIEEANGNPVLVFYWFKHDRERLIERYKQSKELNSEKDIIAWNQGKTKLLLAHPASAGHGLNLQAGGNIIVWFGLTWSLELYQQANARLHRQGQKESVIIHHLIMKDTVDEDIMLALDNKAGGQNDLMTAVRAQIDNIRTTIKGK